MLYENQKLFNQIIKSESENLVKEIELYKQYYEEQLEIVKEKNKKIDEMKNRMEQKSRDRVVIEHYESIT
jgi:L-amino acid N-acyltransferase YncA